MSSNINTLSLTACHEYNIIVLQSIEKQIYKDLDR